MRKMLISVAFVVVAASVLFAYSVGQRSARGAACLEAALSVVDGSGRSIRSEVSGKPGARVDSTFWGTHCSVSAAYPVGSEWVGGRWVYVPDQGMLFASDQDAERFLPAGGNWNDYASAAH